MKYVGIGPHQGLDRLVVREGREPRPGPTDILVRVRASSLNFHDYSVAVGRLPVPEGRVPMSDGAGEVVAVGNEVSEFKIGDQVLSLFFPHWRDGPPDAEKRRGVPGDHIDGFAAEFVAMPASAFTRLPSGYSLEEAASLPCAALTAWSSLMNHGGLRPGQWVLTQGAGGVSIFALQFAKAAGARVIATSSSEARLEKLRVLGADHTINYRQIPDWGRVAMDLTGGRGVDCIVEVGGPGTMANSVTAARAGGRIALIGVLTGRAGEISTASIFTKAITINGISVGSRRDQLDMIEAIEATGLRPVMDSAFPLDDIRAAFAHQEAGRHFGKIGLTI